MVQNWESLVARKRAEVAKELPQEWRLPAEILDTISASADISVLDVPRESGILTAKEIDITEKHDAVALVEKMASKALTASEVTLAFCKRAAIAHQVVSHEKLLDLLRLILKDQLSHRNVLWTSSRKGEVSR
jgi:amidase